MSNDQIPVEFMSIKTHETVAERGDTRYTQTTLNNARLFTTVGTSDNWNDVFSIIVHKGDFSISFGLTRQAAEELIKWIKEDLDWDGS